MNWSRILFGGLLAGMVINAGEYLLHRIVLQQDWGDLMQRFKETPAAKSGEFAVLTVAGFLMGVLTVWLYAAIRVRSGPGPRTALSAALAVWIPGYFLGLIVPLMLSILPAKIVFLSMVAGLVELIFGALLGGLLYRDLGDSLTSVAGTAATERKGDQRT